MHSTLKDGRHARSLIDFGALYAYLFCMMASNLLLSMPILGGALYLSGRVAFIFSQLRQPLLSHIIPRSLRRTGTILLIFVFLLLLALMMILPIELQLVPVCPGVLHHAAPSADAVCGGKGID